MHLPSFVASHPLNSSSATVRYLFEPLWLSCREGKTTVFAITGALLARRFLNRRTNWSVIKLAPDPALKLTQFRLKERLTMPLALATSL